MSKQILSRRELLKAAGVASMVAATQAIWPRWMPRVAFASEGVQGDVIVCIFLRGGADALNMIVPFGDADYYRARPTLSLAPPDSSRQDAVLELTDFFGLNPDMAALHELFGAGHMSAIHAVGAPHAPRSHFEAMDLIERGTDGEQGASSGWLGRYLASTSNAGDSPLRAIGWGENLQTSLHGYVSATALQSITDFHLAGDSERQNQVMAALTQLYQPDAALNGAASATIETLELIQKIDVDGYQPSEGAVYGEDEFARALKQTAALIKADAGLEVACIDMGGYDTHVTQGGILNEGIGFFPSLVKSLADNLRAFHDDLQQHMTNTTVVVMSEFGRRVQENGAAGTDHGHGGVMFVLSPHLRTVPVHGTWPGVNPNFLENGDLAITTDYRDVLSEILQQRTAHANLNAVFPGYTNQRIHLFG